MPNPGWTTTGTDTITAYWARLSAVIHSRSMQMTYTYIDMLVTSRAVKLIHSALRPPARDVQSRSVKLLLRICSRHARCRAWQDVVLDASLQAWVIWDV
jgi:hypothetical protein